MKKSCLYGSKSNDKVTLLNQIYFLREVTVKRLLTGIAAASLMLTALSLTANAATIKILTSWNKNVWPTYVVLYAFVKNVKAHVILKKFVALDCLKFS